MGSVKTLLMSYRFDQLESDSWAKRHRSAAVFVAGIAIALALAWGAWQGFKNWSPQTKTLEEALWVCDWSITRIYGPGTQEQASVVDQFRSVGLAKLEFTAPILYRMGGPRDGDPREGILLNPFDPRHPESALALASSKREQKGSDKGGESTGEMPSN